jgi:hypothetical protein
MGKPVAIMFLALLMSAAAPAHAQQQKEPALQWGGFADAIFTHSLRSRNTALSRLELDAYLRLRFSDNWSFLTEGLLERDRRHEQFDDPGSNRVEFNVERFFAAYDPSDRFRVELGQIHTGIIAWNEREHRSRFLQTPIDVPSIARGEEQGGAWPLHFLGAWTSGRVPGPLGLRYGAGLGEARAAVRGDIQPPLDEKTNAAALLTLGIAPDIAAGLDVSIARYQGHIPAASGALREHDSTIAVSYARGGFDARGEWAQMIHERTADMRSFRTRGWYAQVSWRPRGRWEMLRPYVLLDRLSVARGEEYLADVSDENAWAAGMRWDVLRRLVVKGDLRSQLTRQGNREKAVRLQVAVSF